MFFKHFKNQKLLKACGRPDLITKDTDRIFKKKKKFFRRAASPQAVYFKRKRVRGTKKGDKCFICKQPGHYAKQCPQKATQQHLLDLYCPEEDDDLESLYEEEGTTPTNDSVFCIRDLDLATKSPSDSSSTDEAFHLDDTILTTEPSTPSIKIQLLPDKYDRAINIIAVLDTGAAASMMNPSILPPSCWKPTQRFFKTANGEIMTVNLISKPICLRLFPDFTIHHQFLGSTGPGKDMLIAFDLIKILLRHQIHFTSEGLKRKAYFQPWTKVQKFFSIQDTFHEMRNALIQGSCAETHADFLHKCDHPLWQNSDFFISLPFKKNEDINPTKASHFGMHPDHQKMAEDELSQLSAQGLIESTTSPWACQAFYVNKRAEQVRGKLRLVIDYKPLNLFLADDKFPLPRREVLLQKLPNAKLFSKFDLKAGFWQLGIHPQDRYKTAFCIPNFHYQWTVMPFGLKNAPSEFQKAMTKIFQPLLSSALVYIDDILLFSEDPHSHLELLRHFRQLVCHHGIMLSEKKMHIAQSSVNFLGLIIQEGKIQLQPHIATSLQQFPDEHLTLLQLQQFLGLVNYMKDFVPNISHYRSPLSQLLQKTPPKWTSNHTSAVKALKQVAAHLPSLTIPTETGRRILQTDASDSYWGAVLLDESQRRAICGYHSGQFKVSEQHYHSTFKEILAVKKAIDKFKFHLVGRHFLVEMDMTAFPAMLNKKTTIVPNPQLIRWKNWFDQWKFDVKHLKGKHNFLPDFLSRPTSFHPSQYTILPIFMMEPSSSSSSPPPIWVHLPPHLKESILKTHFHHTFLSSLYCCLAESGFWGKIWPIIFHPRYPFFTILDLTIPSHFVKTAYVLLRNLMRICTIGCLFEKNTALAFLNLALIGRLQSTWHEYSYFPQFLSLFMPLSQWVQEFSEIPFQNVLITFHSHWWLSTDHTGASYFNENFHFSVQISTDWNYIKYPHASMDQWLTAHAIICQLNNQDPNQLPSSVWNPSLWLDWEDAIFPPEFKSMCQIAYQVWIDTHPMEAQLAQVHTSDTDNESSDPSEDSGPYGSP